MRGARDVFTPINESSWSFGKIWVGPVKKPIIIWAADEDVGGELDKISNHHWNNWTPIPCKANGEAFFQLGLFCRGYWKQKSEWDQFPGSFGKSESRPWLAGWLVCPHFHFHRNFSFS